MSDLQDEAVTELHEGRILLVHNARGDFPAATILHPKIQAAG
eukprot:CAMPEP_0194769498 /NCGR_PEP_ID=MMETSP0323_2-20130528/43338_1 /TAXON_ID=2866 ORGANISM="Crypthecodinium cohnii, Strain Seligo" /NCGR_SAMPLE_ID=MMETSP0323_2 /ASSEMBLY_ACC=CAM_ASM_000346 /LENGTH=41 /DNA_ID= /DNA_START= /DNA_END= /DNA_ORIENTATION=